MTTKFSYDRDLAVMVVTLAECILQDSDPSEWHSTMRVAFAAEWVVLTSEAALSVQQLTAIYNMNESVAFALRYHDLLATN